MKITDILLEYNENRLVRDFGQKIINRVNSDVTAPSFHNGMGSTADIIKKIASADPTPNKELTFWLCLNYANNGIARWEDIDSKAVPALLKFKALLRKPNLNPPLQIRDINQIKGLSALTDITEKYQEKETQSNSQLADQEEANFYKSKQAELIYNDNQVKVIVPKTKEAAIFFGKGTRWCTAATNNNYFSDYNKKGPLYIVIIKGTNEKYQFHWESDQFMDASDHEINPNKLAGKYPILWKIFTPIAEENKSLILNLNPTEKMQLAAVTENSYAIQYIKNPSEAVKIAAVKKNGCAIYWIKNPTEAVQLAAVTENSYAIRCIENPSEAVQLAAVRQDGCAIEYIKNPSEKMQLIAVKVDGRAIEYIKNPSEEMQLIAVRQNGHVIRWIKNPSEAVQLAAVTEDGYAIQYIKNPSEEVRMAAKY